MCRWKFLLALLICLPVIVQADIYQWADPDGVVNYSDMPRNGATVIKTLPQSTVSTPASQPSSNPAAIGDTANPANANVSNAQTYQSVQITKPYNGFTYVNSNDGQVNILVNVQPQLQAGDTIQILLDGQATGGAQTTTTITLTGIERGQHSLQAQILNANNQVILSSNSTTFYMQRVRILPKPLQGNNSNNVNLNNVRNSNFNNAANAVSRMNNNQ